MTGNEEDIEKSPAVQLSGSANVNLRLSKETIIRFLLVLGITIVGGMTVQPLSFEITLLSAVSIHLVV